ncbi:MAG: hypothetical protein E7Z69_02785 [Thermoplasmata archaeon]|jgi:hypothetical protein|nr:hypothetical protein [Thermoplasmata archaeon]
MAAFHLLRLHQHRGDDLVEGLLHHLPTACFKQMTLAVHYLPTLVQHTVRRIIGGAEIESASGIGVAEQKVPHILRERIVEEVDIRPFDIVSWLADPILIRQAQPHAPLQ